MFQFGVMMASDSRSLLTQLVVFAAVFTLFQAGFEIVRTGFLSGRVFVGILATTAVATAIYGAFTWMLRNRQKNED